MSKHKKWAELVELRRHLTQLGYPQHIINQHIGAHQWFKQFQPTARNGKRSASTT